MAAKAKPIGAETLMHVARWIAALKIDSANQFAEQQAILAEILQNKKWESH